MAIKQPANQSHFILPDLGEGLHEAELIRWCVEPGQKVSELQTMAEMETDKALVEVPSPWAGVIKELRGKAGDIIEVGSILVTYELCLLVLCDPPDVVHQFDWVFEYLVIDPLNNITNPVFSP